ncbi:MAG TPA: DNA sulfur modification protein DndD [Cyanobacteria bacterium UBA11149]|nr:DNA sulfur modification protein DndD [Cyanobacteria bacterium UBA11367]HBE57852.1 DNA sulfur modification protein DndD [Cyanobacteria bacterium UBA11366]HBK61961.1 DNA sulfur modification protein DndD [Cyanobacteria bacterium UBA11166]HBR76538.1 DNA sulfur modification protein DndD [Cyanobacteria bacterium UBA11159]HBS67920.1 DNA sulfur modification protein DndD [Cyanobacteria bacterium UBA11153]HBW87675.1 DNA sulfur modification protein DndD [Cyanobacteria bacterium UBA11149]HCA96485.1 DN
MIFLELVLQNFGPYRGRQVINLRPEKENNSCPIILFGGMNGGGKTTLMDAIRLTLYGNRAQCSTRGNLSYSEFLAQCVNQHTSPIDQTRIELLFEHIQDNKPTKLRVVRYWSKNPKDGKDTLGILVGDDEWPDQALLNTWEEFIETILPLGISNLFLFDGEQVKELAELETPPPTVVEAIQSLLGLELAERLSQDIDILVSRKRKKLVDVQQLANIDEIEQKIQEIKNERDANEREKNLWKNKLKSAEVKQSRAYQKFIAEGGKIAAERSQLDRQFNDVKVETQETRKVMMELAADVLPLALISPILQEAKSQAEKETHREQAEIAIAISKQRDRRLLDYITKLSLNSEQLNKIEVFLEAETQAIAQEIAADEKPWLNAESETINQLNHLLQSEIKTIAATAKDKLECLKTLEIEIDSLERQLAAAASPEAYQELEKSVEDAQNEAAKLKANWERLNQRSEQLEREIKKMKHELENYSKKAIEIQNDRHIINASAKVQQTLKLFREKLTLRKLNKLEVEVTECFRYLLHKSDLVHRVAIDTNTFSLSIYDSDGKPVPKHRLSAGEKQLLAIAFLWGLARIAGRQLPVAIDTPLGRLDSSHRINLIERYFPSASHQVILLSTDTEIGKTEVQNLRNQDAIAREYRLNYSSEERQTVVELGYFW